MTDAPIHGRAGLGTRRDDVSDMFDPLAAYHEHLDDAPGPGRGRVRRRTAAAMRRGGRRP